MAGMKSKEDQKPAIQVLERMFSLLDLLASHQDPVSLKLISEQTGLHPSTAHRILNDLTVGRYVDREVVQDAVGGGGVQARLFADQLQRDRVLVGRQQVPVSYTHLTLPTICSV